MAQVERYDDRNPSIAGSGKRQRSHEEQDLLRPRSFDAGNVKLLAKYKNTESRSVLTLTLVNADDGPYSNGTSVSRPWNRERSVSPERPLAPLILPSAVARHVSKIGPPALKRPMHIRCAPKLGKVSFMSCSETNVKEFGHQNLARKSSIPMAIAEPAKSVQVTESNDQNSM
jgi:hypothetical protein